MRISQVLKKHMYDKKNLYLYATGQIDIASTADISSFGWQCIKIPY
jgi:hypothetical protein